jgi:hypothetical protein
MNLFAPTIVHGPWAFRAEDVPAVLPRAHLARLASLGRLKRLNTRKSVFAFQLLHGVPLDVEGVVVERHFSVVRPRDTDSTFAAREFVDNVFPSFWCGVIRCMVNVVSPRSGSISRPIRADLRRRVGAI